MPLFFSIKIKTIYVPFIPFILTLFPVNLPTATIIHCIVTTEAKKQIIRHSSHNLKTHHTKPTKTLIKKWCSFILPKFRFIVFFCDKTRFSLCFTPLITTSKLFHIFTLFFILIPFNFTCHSNINVSFKRNKRLEFFYCIRTGLLVMQWSLGVHGLENSAGILSRPWRNSKVILESSLFTII